MQILHLYQPQPQPPYKDRRTTLKCLKLSTKLVARITMNSIQERQKTSRQKN